MSLFVWPVQIYYEDTDAAGVVYYANYLKYMERARTEWLRNLGYQQDDLAQREGVVFVVRHVELDYHRPARFNDVIYVGVRVLKQNFASVTFEQCIFADADQQTLLCRGVLLIACLDSATFRPKPFPPALLPDD